MKLSMGAQDRAVAFIRSKARPLEQALYAFHFENAGPDGVLDSLAAFQNPDGGFGHGLEPDLTLPDSSVICTTRGLQTLAEIGASPDRPAVKSGVRYLLETYDAKRKVWEIVPPSVNEYPRADWWDYTPDQEMQWGGYLANPRAEVLGCLLGYQTHVPPVFLKELTSEVLSSLERSLGKKPNMHDLNCYLTLLDAKSLTGDVRTRLTSLLEPMVLSAVERDPAK
jgi:hypothetical protein